MRIIKVDAPIQNDTTLNKQCIDGKYPNWVVMTEGGKLNEGFNEWWSRKKEYMNSNPSYEHVDGIYLYDVQPVTKIIGEGGEIDPKLWALHIRYDYIKNKE